MAYTPPTPADFKVRFPRFVDVDDAVIAGALDRAARVVDESWPEGDFAEGRMLHAAHDMTLDGVGTGTEAQLNAEGVGDFQSIKLGSLSLSRFSKAERAADAVQSGYESTTFGQRFWALASRFLGGPISGGSIPADISPYARDVPTLPGLQNRWPGNG